MTRRLASTTARTDSQTPPHPGANLTLGEVALFVGGHAAVVAAVLAVLAATIVALPASRNSEPFYFRGACRRT
ncbi:MAG: hypothetical protein V5A23_07240 [Halobacteriales archaeon]